MTKGKLPRQVLGRIALEVVFRRAVLDVAASAGSVKKRRMRLGDADDVGSHIKGDRLDVARHRRGIVHRDFLRIDFAVARPVDHVGQKMSAIGEVIRRRDAGQRIFGDGVAIPVEERFAELAALIFRMRRLVHVDVDMRADDFNRSPEIRRGKFFAGVAAVGARSSGGLSALPAQVSVP